MTDQAPDARALVEKLRAHAKKYESGPLTMMICREAADLIESLRAQVESLTNHDHDDQLIDGWWVCNSCGRRQKDNHAAQVESKTQAIGRLQSTLANTSLDRDVHRAALNQVFAAAGFGPLDGVTHHVARKLGGDERVHDHRLLRRRTERIASEIAAQAQVIEAVREWANEERVEEPEESYYWEGRFDAQKVVCSILAAPSPADPEEPQ